MKYIIIIAVFISGSAFGQKIESKQIKSAYLNFERSIWIYTPSQYEDFPDKKLEVVYVFDAQNRGVFDVVHSTLQFIGGQEFAFIVVGVQSPYNEKPLQHRNIDMLPKAETKEGIESYGQYAGGADKFMNYVQKEVVPFIDKNYRTLPERIAVGHSNGGTFISYCLLQNPELFDAIIAISPNYAYDKGQMVSRFEKLKPTEIASEKFIYLSNSNENSATSERWKGWVESREKIVKILKDEKFKSKIHLEMGDFSATESHGTTYPVGVFYGLKSFIDYQYRTGENVVAYYERLARENLIELNPDRVNMFAYECFWAGKSKDAITVINWAIKKFPDSHNLYDSKGEFYEKAGALDKAKESFQMAVEVLSKAKNEIDDKDYSDKLRYYSTNIQRVSE